MMRTRLLALFLALVPACALSGKSGETAVGRTVGAVTIGRPLPALSFRDNKGKPHGLAEFRGKVVLFDVWASWCEPCKVELPMLDDMAERLRGDGVEVVAVSIDQDEANMRDFIGQRRRWRVRFFHDPAGQVPDRLQPPKMPTSYILDRQGVVHMVNEGFEPADAPRLEQRLRALAARP